MAIVIEDGSLVEGANSYIEVADANTYATSMGYTGDAVTESSCIQSYVMMKSLPWCVSHSEAYTVTQAHKDGQAEIAYRIQQGFDIGVPQDAQNVKRERVDVIETEYFNQGITSSMYSLLVRMPLANAHLGALLCPRPSRMIRI